MNKEMLTISIEDYVVDTAEEFARAIEWRIEHDALDAVEARLNQHGWFKERTCKMETGYSGYDSLVCSECGEYTTVYHKGKYCSGCGAKVVE